MLFHKAVAAISILAVGGANASLEWTEVGSNVPRNKPDGRVIFGKTLQRRSLCNHDDCDEPELTTIIIGGGGTLPPMVSFQICIHLHANKDPSCRFVSQCSLIIYCEFHIHHSPCLMWIPTMPQVQCILRTRLRLSMLQHTPLSMLPVLPWYVATSSSYLVHCPG